jgi:hypothetical protein
MTLAAPLSRKRQLLLTVHPQPHRHRKMVAVPALVLVVR